MPWKWFDPQNRQQQFGGTFGGPIRSNRVFFFAGYDQHVFHVPTVVNFLTNTATDFLQLDKAIGIRYFPAYYQRPATLTRATSAYAPRPIQFALKVIF